jgi:asparagine synthase (glutamine-hydrolysing)
MPGICGVARHTPGPIQPLLGAMCHRLAHYPWHRVSEQVASDGAAGLGAVLLDHAAGRAGLSSDQSTFCAFEGEVYDTADARAALVKQGIRVDDDTMASLLVRGLWLEGHHFFARIHGSFAIAAWDAERRRLLLVNDRFGQRPVYFAHAHGRLIFASEIASLLQDATMDRRISPDGLGQFLAFGQFLGDATLFEGVRLLPPGSVLEYDVRDDRVNVSQYGSTAGDTGPPMSSPEALDAVVARFARSVERSTADASSGPYGLSLSGGLDARTILAAIPGHTALSTVSLGMPGSMDHDAAAVLSALVGRTHHQHMLGRAFLATFEQDLRQMVRLTDGHYLDQGIVMTTLPLYRELGIKTLLRGHAGELCHMRKAYAFSLDADGERIDSDAGLRSWLLSHLTDYMLGAIDGPLLAPRVGADVREVAAAALDRSLASVQWVEPPLQRVWHLFVRERVRRETVASLHMFRNFVEVRVPYLDGDLVDLLLMLPPEMKLDASLQSYILQKIRPEFLRVTNTNTGAPMNAGTWRTRMGSLRMKVFAKMGVPGYQPYERLGLWLTRELKPLLQSTILSERFLDRGLFDADRVRQAVAQHESRERNHTFLIMAMLILELAHQELFEMAPVAH